MTNTSQLTYDPMVIRGDCGDRLWLEVCGWSSARLTVFSRREGSGWVLPLDTDALDSLRNEITLCLSVMAAQRLASLDQTNFESGDNAPDATDPDDLPF